MRKKILLWVVAVMLFILILAMMFSPAIIRYAINNYSKEVTGRQITVQDVDFNLFNGVCSIEGLNIKEADDHTDFVDIQLFMVNTDLPSIISGNYSISELRIDAPSVRIVQNGERFNFDDLLERFSIESTAPKVEETSESFFEVKGISIDHGRLYYTSALVPKPLEVDSLHLEVPLFSSEDPRIEAMLKLFLGWGGSIAADIDLDLNKKDYQTTIRSAGMELSALKVYIDPYMDLSTFQGQLDSDLSIAGKFNNAMELSLTGTVGIRDVELTDPSDQLLAGLGYCQISIDSVNVKDEIYRLHSFALHRPHLHFELYEESDNFSRLLKLDSSSTVSEEAQNLGYDPDNPFSMLAHYTKEVVHSYKNGSYKVDSLELRDGSINFVDHSLIEPFRAKVDDLTFSAYGIDSRQEVFDLDASATLNEHGTLVAHVSMDPNQLKDLTCDLEINSVGMPVFGPYSIFYSALPILEGNSKYTNHTVIQDGQIKSENHIRIEQFTYGKKLKEVDPQLKLPLRLAVAILRDQHGNIDLEIPVRGDLNDPDYKIGKVVLQILRNVIVKCVSAPYTLIARSLNVDEEDLKTLHYQQLQVEVSEDQVKTVNTLAKVLEQKPDLRLQLVQSGDSTLEMTALAIAFVKAEFLGLDILPIQTTILVQIDSLADTDSLFIDYVDQRVGPERTDLPLAKKCQLLLPSGSLPPALQQLCTARNAALQNFLLEEKALTEDQILVRNIQAGDSLIATGSPKYQILFGVSNAER